MERFRSLIRVRERVETSGRASTMTRLLNTRENLEKLLSRATDAERRLAFSSFEYEQLLICLLEVKIPDVREEARLLLEKTLAGGTARDRAYVKYAALVALNDARRDVPGDAGGQVAACEKLVASAFEENDLELLAEVIGLACMHTELPKFRDYRPLMTRFGYYPTFSSGPAWSGALRVIAKTLVHAFLAHYDTTGEDLGATSLTFTRALERELPFFLSFFAAESDPRFELLARQVLAAYVSDITAALARVSEGDVSVTQAVPQSLHSLQRRLIAVFRVCSSAFDETCFASRDLTLDLYPITFAREVFTRGGEIYFAQEGTSQLSLVEMLREITERAKRAPAREERRGRRCHPFAAS